MAQSPMRTVGRWLGILIVAFFAYTGLHGGVTEWSQASTVGQHTQVVFQYLYGAMSLVLLFFAMRNSPNTRRVGMLWTATAIPTAGLAPIVWGNAPIFAGIAAGGSVVLLGALIIWLLRPVAAATEAPASKAASGP